jgi:hypothetical protein
MNARPSLIQELESSTGRVIGDMWQPELCDGKSPLKVYAVTAANQERRRTQETNTQQLQAPAP